MATEAQWEKALKDASARHELAMAGLREALDIADELACREDGRCICGSDIMNAAEHHADGCRYAALRSLAET
jgi:hypothetical protein